MYKKAIRKNKILIKKVIENIRKKVTDKILSLFFETISVNITILPILINTFNKVNIANIIISMISSIIIAPIIVLGWIYVLIPNKVIKMFLQLLLKCLINIAKIGNNIFLNQIYWVTPHFIQIFLYYFMLMIFIFILKIKQEKRNNSFYKRIKNLISLLKFKYMNNKNCVKYFVFIIFILYFCSLIIPSNLKIHFIDVNQGDSTLIITPNHRNILIDGGGGEKIDVR